MEYTLVDIEESVVEYLAEENLELYDINIVNFPNIDKIEIFIFTQDQLDYNIISRINYQLQRHFEIFNLHKGEYELIISSPGVERSLKTKRHFELAQEEKIKVKVYDPVNSVYTFSGKLTNVNDEFISISLEDEKNIDLHFENIKRAKIQFDKFKEKVN